MRSQKGFISSIVGTIALLVIAVTVGGYVTWQSRIPQDDGTTPNLYSYGKRKAPPPTPPRQGKVCTQDAKQCPDGSFVSRQGPTCEFAACPGEKLTPQSAIPTNWKTYCINGTGITFNTPSEFKLGIDDTTHHTKNGCLNFGGYPRAGYYSIGVIGNYPNPTTQDIDQIYNNNIKEATEIVISGLNYPLKEYLESFSTVYKQTTNAAGVYLYEPIVSISDRLEVVVEVQPSEDSSDTQAVLFTIRTADPKKIQEIKALFDLLKDSIRLKTK